MATYYVEYPTGDGGSVLVEVEDREGRIVKASNRSGSTVRSRVDFASAFKHASSSIRELIAGLKDMDIEEADIKFGLKSTGEAGFFAVGKVGGELNYEITLKWKKAAARKAVKART